MTRVMRAEADNGDPNAPPLVSVLLPVFNAEKYLRAAIRSLQVQDHPHLEIVAIDDGSTDGSLRILQAFAAADPRLRVFSRENRGLVATLNEAMALARGDLLARMDADDIAYPDRLSAQVACFRADPDLALCGCRYDVIFGDDRVAPVGGLANTRPRDLAVLSLFFTMLLHPTVMYRRGAVAPEALRYDETYPFAEDFDLFRRLAAAYPAQLVDRPLLAYRLHDQSVSALRKAAMRRTHLRIVAENLRRAHGCDLDADLAEIVDRATPATVERAAAAIATLDGLAARSAEDLRAAYREGVENLFFFFYTIIWDAQDAELLARFVDRCGRWDRIRRRERYLLRARRPSRPVLAALRWLDGAARRIESVPARRAIAGYGAL